MSIEQARTHGPATQRLMRKIASLRDRGKFNYVHSLHVSEECFEALRAELYHDIKLYACGSARCFDYMGLKVVEHDTLTGQFTMVYFDPAKLH